MISSMAPIQRGRYPGGPPSPGGASPEVMRSGSFGGGGAAAAAAASLAAAADAAAGGADNDWQLLSQWRGSPRRRALALRRPAAAAGAQPRGVSRGVDGRAAAGGRQPRHRRSRAPARRADVADGLAAPAAARPHRARDEYGRLRGARRVDGEELVGPRREPRPAAVRSRVYRADATPRVGRTGLPLISAEVDMARSFINLRGKTGSHARLAAAAGDCPALCGHQRSHVASWAKVHPPAREMHREPASAERLRRALARSRTTHDAKLRRRHGGDEFGRRRRAGRRRPGAAPQPAHRARRRSGGCGW